MVSKSLTPIEYGTLKMITETVTKRLLKQSIWQLEFFLMDIPNCQALFAFDITLNHACFAENAL